ncbi:hypothetical protein VKT23_009876 [Stygiomarasmius scandens]|uniref:Uncharacterized protein n=1 Tax=Marasmiellus scandens TaxID=2682957 RepID=A0ABR1JGX2_9AGAR
MKIERFKKEVQNRLDRFTAQGTRVGVEAGLPKCDGARRSVNNSARPSPSIPSSPSTSEQNNSPETTNAVDHCSSPPGPTHSPVTRGSGLAVAPFMSGANISSSALNGVAGNQANVANRNGHNNTGNVNYNSYNNCIVFR